MGQALIHIHTGVNNRYGYSIENSKRTWPTLEAMFADLPGLRRSMYGLGPDVPLR